MFRCAVALGYFLSKSLVKTIDRGAMPNKGKLVVKMIFPVAYFAGAVFLAMATAPLFASSEGFTKTSSPVPASSGRKPVMAFTTIQSAEGVTEADLDQTGLKNFETWLVEENIK